MTCRSWDSYRDVLKYDRESGFWFVRVRAEGFTTHVEVKFCPFCGEVVEGPEGCLAEAEAASEKGRKISVGDQVRVVYARHDGEDLYLHKLGVVEMIPEKDLYRVIFNGGRDWGEFYADELELAG